MSLSRPAGPFRVKITEINNNDTQASRHSIETVQCGLDYFLDLITFITVLANFFFMGSLLFMSFIAFFGGAFSGL